MSAFAQGRYEGMRYHRCGQSGLKLPAISLGTWEIFAGNGGEDAAQEYFYRAFDLGITHFDLAYSYGRLPVEAEVVLGKILRAMPRDELIIGTGAGHRVCSGACGERLSRKSLMVCLDQSLKRLGLDYVDIFYVHRPDPETPLEETMGTLDLILRQGKALYIGLSDFAGVHFLNAFTTMAEMSRETITLSQAHYDLLDRSAEISLFAHTLRTGTGVLTICPLAQWLLTEQYLQDQLIPDSLPIIWRNGQQREQRSPAELLDQVKRFDSLARERGQSLAQMALAWNLHHAAVTGVLVSPAKVEHLNRAVASLQHLSFSAEELRLIDEITVGAYSRSSEEGLLIQTHVSEQS